MTELDISTTIEEMTVSDEIDITFAFIDRHDDTVSIADDSFVVFLEELELVVDTPLT